MKNKLLSIIFAAMMVVGSPLLAFAYDDTTLKTDISKNVVITMPDGREIIADDLQCIKVTSDDTDMSEEASDNTDATERAVVRNWILINKNTAAPLFASADGEVYYSEEIVESEEYSGTDQFMYMTITQEQRDSRVAQISSYGYTFANAWYVFSYFTVDSADPISITYTENGETKVMNNISNGVYRLKYITPDGYDDSVITGYLTFRYNGIGTAGFNCGVSFAY